MKFFGVHIEDLESDRFLSASNDQIATWLFLHTLCSKQMNGGTIPEASSLSERFWNHHGISAGIIIKSSPLWSWSGDELTVEPYDIDGETLYLKKSKGGKAGAAKRWKGSENRSPNRSPKGSADAYYQTRPEITRPDQTRPSSSPIGEGVNDLFEASSLDPSSKTNPLHELAESIYQEYPRKVAKKPGLEAILKAMKSKSPAFLKEKVMEFSDATKGQVKRFLPHPATWFNEERFNDDPEEWKQSNGQPPPPAPKGNQIQR